MRFSPLVSRIGGKGAQAWRVHYEAEAAKKQGRDAVLLSVGDPDLHKRRRRLWTALLKR